MHGNYDKKFRKNAKEEENSKRIVLELIEELEKGHIVFAYSYYTSVELAKELENRGLGCLRFYCEKAKGFTVF